MDEEITEAESGDLETRVREGIDILLSCFKNSSSSDSSERRTETNNKRQGTARPSDTDPHSDTEQQDDEHIYVNVPNSRQQTNTRSSDEEGSSGGETTGEDGPDTTELLTRILQGVQALFTCLKTTEVEEEPTEEPEEGTDLENQVKDCTEVLFKYFRSSSGPSSSDDEDGEVETGTETTLNNLCEEDQEEITPASCWIRLNLLAATLLLGCSGGLQVYRDVSLALMYGEEVPESITLTEGTLFAVFGVVSGTLTILICYRWVSLIGGAVMALGFLVTSFLDSANIHPVAVTYAVLPGIGRNFVVVPATIVVLEYAKKYGEKSLILSQTGVVTITSVLTIINTYVIIPRLGIQLKIYLYLQTAIAVAMALVSLVLRPLDSPEVATEEEAGREGNEDASHKETSFTENERTTENESRRAGGNERVTEQTNEGTAASKTEGTIVAKKEETVVARILGYNSLIIYRRPFLYTFAFTWYFWSGGNAIIEGSVSALDTSVDVRLLRLVSYLGLLVLFLVLKLRGLNLLTLSVVIVVSCAGAGLASFGGSLLDNRVIAIGYVAFVGVLKGAADPALLYTTKLVVGEEHLAIGTGVLVLGQGLGVVTMTTAAGEILKATGRIDEGLYLTGGLLLLGAGVTMVTYFLVKRNTK